MEVRASDFIEVNVLSQSVSSNIILVERLLLWCRALLDSLRNTIYFKVSAMSLPNENETALIECWERMPYNQTTTSACVIV